MRKNIIIFIIILALILAAGGFFWWWELPSTKPKNHLKKNEQVFATGNYYRLSFNYPLGWHIFFDETNLYLDKFPINGMARGGRMTPIQIEVKLLDERGDENLSLPDIQREVDNLQEDLVNTKRENILVDTEDAVRIEGDLPNAYGDLTEKLIFTIFPIKTCNSKLECYYEIFNISLGSFEEIDEEMLNAYNHLVSSIKILDKPSFK